MKKPIQRSKARLAIGKGLYSIKTYMHWYASRTNFATARQKSHLPYVIAEHRSVLLRQLKDVDMWMQHNKITNLKIAIEQLNEIVLEPGQVLSYWRQIGRPTAKKGYLDGMVLFDGKVQTGVGGGLCQLSNLIFWMTLHTPLTVSERWRHTYDVFPDVKRTQPFGSGATCAYPNIDLKIDNTTHQRFQLRLWLSETHLHGEWRSDKPITTQYEISEKDHTIEHEPWGGYTRHNRIFRRVIDTQTGEEMQEECVAENHAIMMYNPLLGQSTKDDS